MIRQVNDLAVGWWSWMFPMLWQTALLAGFVWALDLLLRRRGWPQVRLVFWLMVFARLLVPPSFALPTSLSARLIAAGGPMVSTAQPLAGPTEFTPAVSPRATVISPGATVRPAAPEAVSPAPAAPAASQAAPALSWRAWAMLASAGVSALLFTWLVVKLLRLRRLARRESCCRPVSAGIEEMAARLAARLGLRRLPRIAATAELPSAAVCGIFRPILFLAQSSLALPPEQLEHVLLHELAHLKRRDLLVNAAQSLLQIVYWFNPALWFAGRQSRHLREICCDAAVRSLLRERTGEYSRTLVELAGRTLNANAGPALGMVGLFEGPSRLRERIEYLRRPAPKRRWLRWIGTASATAAVALFIAPMGAVKAATLETPKGAKDSAAAQPQVQRREVNRLVSAFPQEADLSTPESACAAYMRASARMDAKAVITLSWAKIDASELEGFWKKADQADLAMYNKAQLDSEVLEVLTYRDKLAAVISRLEFPPGKGRNPFSLRLFGCIDGKWKNMGEDRCASLEDARNDFERKKGNMWTYFEELQKGGGAAATPAPSAGAMEAIDKTKAELMGRVEDFFQHNYRDITARKTLEWGDVKTDEKGNRSIRYKYLATVWDKDKFIDNQIFTFDPEGKFVSAQNVAGFPQKYAPEPEDTSTQAGLIKLVEKFFTRNFMDVTARETVEWGPREVLPNGNLSIRYKYNATIWNKDHVVMNQVFTFDPKGEFVSCENVEGFPKPQ